MSMFSKATRKKVKLRLALCGVSGSGKTYSALLLAKGLGGKCAVIDTENGSASLYEGIADYDVCELRPPFTTEKYINAIKEAEREGYDVLIIDSLSHAWAGQGGLLEQVDNITAASRSKNSYTSWRSVTPLHNRLVDTILQSNMHIVVTMRSKTAYETTKDEKGKMSVVKAGLAPVQRDGLEYEFTTVLDLENSRHMATAGKDRTHLFDGQSLIIDEEVGVKLKSWLDQGIEEPAAGLKGSQLATLEQKRALLAQANGLGITKRMKELIALRYSVGSSSELTAEQAEDLLVNMGEYAKVLHDGVDVA